MISIEAYCASIGRFYNQVRHFANPQNVVSIRSGNVYMIVIITFFIVVFANTIACSLCIIFIGNIWCCLYKHIDSSCHFIELSYRDYNLNFLKLKQLPLDGAIESNPGPTQNDCKSPVGHTKKIKVFKGRSKKCDLSENNVNVASGPKIVFSIPFNQSAQTLLSYGQLLALALWSDCKNWNLR